MRNLVTSALLAGAVLASGTSAHADDGYFGPSEKQLTFKEEGERTRTQKITLLSLAGGAVLAGAVGGYFMLDAQTQGEMVSASGMHTLKAWSEDLADTRNDALRSNTIATVSFGVGGAFAAATIVAYMITQPEMKVGYQDWQSKRSLPSVAPTAGGIVMSQGWSF
ncbi:MAG: hypothetical protein GY811_28600 [Myxococcales bacterium]|nr:hypothetical protein [Myxococcales bacterium]